MSDESWDINWTVELVNQPTGMSCWAASAAMVVGWRDQISIDVDSIVNGTGDWSAYNKGLNPANVPALADAWKLYVQEPQSYALNGLKDLLSQGPIWVGAAVPGLHAIVVTGAYTDGTYDNTYIRINDPWDRDPGTPGNPGAYYNTHDNGSQYVLTYRQFCDEYEKAASFPNVNIQILRTNGQGQS